MTTLTKSSRLPIQRRVGEGCTQRGPRRPSWTEVAAEAAGDLLHAAESGSVQRLLSELQGSVGNDAVQRLVREHGESANATVAQRIRAAMNGGRPLDSRARREVEPAMGADLSAVRVHDDAESDSLATELGAEAFTTGSDMFFKKGAFDPGSDTGLRTIAHEATHVVQQSRGAVSGRPVGGGISLSEPDDAYERHADEVADRVGGGDAARPSSPASAPGVGRRTVQRKCGCGGTCGPCSSGNDKEQERDNDGEVPIQRLAAPPSIGPLLVQRKAAPSPVDVTFRADADLHSAGTTGVNTNGASGFDPSTELSPANKGEVPSKLLFNVDIDWKPSATKKTGGGPLDCDPCKALDLDLIPDRYKTDCDGLCTFKERKEFVKKLIPELLERPCKLLPSSSAETACQVGGGGVLNFLKGIPVIGSIISGVETLADAVNRLVSPLGKALDALDTVSNKVCKDKDFCEDPDAPNNTGEAHVTSSTMFILHKDGDNDVLVPTGPLPSATSDGKGAQLAVPVQIARESIERGARVSIAPAVVTTGGGAEAHLRQRSFFVDVKLLPKPAPRDIPCTEVSLPFVIGSTKYMNPPHGLGEDGEREYLFNWYFSLQPAVRQEIEEGRALMKLTGRCSTTGSKTFNLDLAKRRAEKVRDIISNFTGNNARIRYFATGEFVSGEDNKEDATQRKVDIAVVGQVAGEKVEGVPDLCTGGFGLPTPGGANIEPKKEERPDGDGTGPVGPALVEAPPAIGVDGGEPVPATVGGGDIGSGLVGTTGAESDGGATVDIGEDLAIPTGGGEVFEPFSFDEDETASDLPVPALTGGDGFGFFEEEE